jgi:hypothetical protein
MKSWITIGTGQDKRAQPDAASQGEPLRNALKPCATFCPFPSRDQEFREQADTPTKLPLTYKYKSSNPRCYRAARDQSIAAAVRHVATRPESKWSRGRGRGERCPYLDSGVASAVEDLARLHGLDRGRHRRSFQKKPRSVAAEEGDLEFWIGDEECEQAPPIYSGRVVVPLSCYDARPWTGGSVWLQAGSLRMRHGVAHMEASRPAMCRVENTCASSGRRAHTGCGGSTTGRWI